MGKAGVTLPPETIEIYRQVFDTVLKANKDFEAVVKDQTTGTTPEAKQKSRLKAINRLIRRNEIFRNAVRGELSKFRISPR
jgi:hypothetical protein